MYIYIYLSIYQVRTCKQTTFAYLYDGDRSVNGGNRGDNDGDDDDAEDDGDDNNNGDCYVGCGNDYFHHNHHYLYSINHIL